MRIYLGAIIVFGLLLAMPAMAQNADFTAEGLSDTDLTQDLAAEALPTTDRAAFWWERVSQNISAAFTFNAERKAELYRAHLHQLDRKAEACAEIGDAECLAKVDAARASLEERTQKFIEKRQELKDRLLQRFEVWRARRAENKDELKQEISERKEKRDILRQERAERRDEARESRKERRNEKFREANVVGDDSLESTTKIPGGVIRYKLDAAVGRNQKRVDEVNEQIFEQESSRPGYLKASLRQRLNSNSSVEVNNKVEISSETER